MRSNSVISVEKPNMMMCPFSLYTSTVILAFFQFVFTSILAILYRTNLEDPTTIVKIVFWIHVCCSVTALLFFVFCMLKRKLGSSYQIVLHAYLLTVLLNGLTSLFGVLYVPLFFLQTEHSLMEGIDYFICFASSAGLLGYQWVVKTLTEQMLPVMEQDFKV